MKKILKILLIILILAIVAGLDVWLVLKKHWQWWVGVAIYAGFLGVWIGILFLRKYLTRRKEKQFVHRVLEIDEAAIKRADVQQRQELKDLQAKWKESIELLRSSNIRRGIKDPIYAMPWYIIIGESGSGKTTAIRNAKINSPISDITRTAGLAATQNCDWWFLENAIILDTAGRYTIPLDESADKEEWEELLVLLAKYRKREPVNGVIVTVSAEKLLSADHMTLRANGQSIRKRIDQIMRVSGAKFPVYVLIAKMDLVYGFTDTFLRLPEEDTEQAAGYMNVDENAGWEKVVEQFFITLEENLHRIRTRIIEKEGDNPEPGIVVFPIEFLSLKPALKEFTKSVFEPNPYQETPVLRGIYFSSALQDIETRSRFLEVGGQPAVCKPKQAESRGLFLKGFFSQVLPQDRYYMRPVYEFVRWRRFTASLGFISVVLIFIALAGLLTVSFFHNVNAVNNFFDRLEKMPRIESSSNIASNLIMLEKLRLEIKEVEETNKRWFMPSFGLTTAEDLEKVTKEHYKKLFNEGFFLNFERDLHKNINKINASTDADTMAAYAKFLIARILVLRSYLEHGVFFKKGKDSEEELKLLRRRFTNLMSFMYPQVPTPVATTAPDIYISYLDWNDSKAELTSSLELSQASLKGILSKHKNLNWIVNQFQLDAYDIYLDDFWTKTGQREGENPIMINGEYTKEGQKRIKQFLQSFEEAGVKETLSDVSVKDFWEWYRTQYFNAWHRFAINFNKGELLVKSDTDKIGMVINMTTVHNPYWTFLERAASELSADDYLPNPPQWVRLIKELSEARKLSEQKEEKEKKDLKEKLLEEEKKIVRDLEKFESKERAAIDRRIDAGNIYVELNKSMVQMAPVATSDENCYRLIYDLFQEVSANAEGKSPFNIAYAQYFKLKHTFKDFKEDVDFVWKLVGGPINYILSYGINKSSCLLQEQWERDVLGKMEGINRDKLPKFLFDKKEGVVWKFTDGPAKPFIAKGKWGYTSRKIYGNTIFEHQMGFMPEFFAFINRGEGAIVSYQPEYKLDIETVPITVNEEASLKPLGVILTVQCADKDRLLSNYNYKDKETFNWSPEKCGDTSLRILFPNLSLTKLYKGQMGFPKFLSDFKTGVRVFSVDEFPDAKDSLRKMGVKWIKIRYRIEHELPVINLLKGSSFNVPFAITRCAIEGKNKNAN